MRVVVDVGPAHLDRLFDYRLEDGQHADVGSRIRVRFNGRPRTAWVAEVTDTPSVAADIVKPVVAVDGDVAWFGAEDLLFWRWVADRYAGTLSGAIAHALPPRVVRVEREASSWGPTRSRNPADRPPCAGTHWQDLAGSALLKAAWQPAGGAFHLRPPIGQPVGPLLVDLVARTTAAGRSALVLSPHPARGPVDDIARALGPSVVDTRRSSSDADRYRAFLRLRRGDVDVVIGGRGLALMPLPDLGLVIVTDEANPAYKERRNPRHHVREAALARGRLSGATVVLTSSLVSPYTHRHITAGHVIGVRADRATERASAPNIRVIDRRALPPAARRTRIVEPISRRMSQVMTDGGAVIVLAAARGSGSSLACRTCRARVECRECGAGMSVRTPDSGQAPTRAPDTTEAPETWHCRICAWQAVAFACIDCGGTETFPLRAGAKRLASELARTFPEADVAHMEGFDQPGPSRRPAIAVMTRGSVTQHPPWLGGTQADLLVIADPDVLLGRPDVDAAEDALRLWLDGAEMAGEVMVQTGQPEHPALQSLARMDPDGFWEAETERRAPLGFPPVGSLIRMTGLAPEDADEIRRDVPGRLLGPDPDGVALLKTDDVRGTIAALQPLRQRWASANRRIRVDVDPVPLT